MKHTLEKQENLTVRQGEVVEMRTADGAVSEVILSTGAVFSVRAAVIATGTYLKGRTLIGECIESSGPDGMHAANRLTDSLLKLGLPLRRFKTGTPPRVNARSVDFDKMELQPGDDSPLPFSFTTQTPPENRAVCHLTWTTEETKRIVLANLDRSPIYGGVIEGVGPRYCPSFETKIVRFPDKLRHQLFVEPMGFGNEQERGPEGFRKNNVFASELTGPILVKNPPLMRKVIAAIYSRRGEALPESLPVYPMEEESFRIACQELKTRIETK